MSPDPRLYPIREDIAARHLAHLAPGRRLVDGVAHQVRGSALALRAAPDDTAEQVSQALHGEIFTVYERRGEWAWGQLAHDGYVAWCRAASLSPELLVPTHRVSVIRTFLFPAPSVKAPPVAALSLNARLSLGEAEKGFIQAGGGGWVHAGHVAEISSSEPDFVAVAQRFVGAPYLWGGRESSGVDCSGLVQSALMAAGVPAPRDADMQEQALGQPAPVGDALQGLQRGDLVFWRGHVGMMLDSSRLLHANAWHMATEIEPIGEAVARIRAVAGEVRSIRRLSLPDVPAI